MYLSIFEDTPNLKEIDFFHEILYKYSVQDIDSLNNLIFYGSKGSGKTTKVYAFLCSLFNNKVYDLKSNTVDYDSKSISYKSSIYHIEIDALELLTGEKVFFTNFLKDYCSTRNIGLGLPKIIYIKNFEHLNKISYLFLRKVIENNYKTSKFIFEVSSMSGVPQSLLSRFFLIRIKLPSENEIFTCLKNYTKRKNIIIEDSIINNILTKTKKYNKYNLKHIFGFLRYYIITGKYFDFFYDQYTEKIIKIIFSKPINLKEIYSLKDIIEDMFVNLIDGSEIIYTIYDNIYERLKLLNNITNELNIELNQKLIEISVKHELNIKKGNKEFIHVLNFIINIIDYIHSKNIL